MELVFGSMRQGYFTIIDQRDPDQTTETRCSDLSKVDLIDYLWYLYVEPPNFRLIRNTNPRILREEVANLFGPSEASTFTEEQNIYAYGWSRYTHARLCAEIQQTLDDLNLIEY